MLILNVSYVSLSKSSGNGAGLQTYLLLLYFLIIYSYIIRLCQAPENALFNKQALCLLLKKLVDAVFTKRLRIRKDHIEHG